jgi:hypothetical protein
MICSLCKRAGNYYTDYKNKNKESDLLNAQQLHWLCSHKPNKSDDCFCGHRAEEIIQA